MKKIALISAAAALLGTAAMAGSVEQQGVLLADGSGWVNGYAVMTNAGETYRVTSQQALQGREPTGSVVVADVNLHDAKAVLAYVQAQHPGEAFRLSEGHGIPEVETK